MFNARSRTQVNIYGLMYSQKENMSTFAT